MNRLAWITGLSGVVALTAWACGEDVAENPATSSTSTSSGSGASGGSSSSSQSSSSSSSSSTSGGGGFANVCEEACYHVETECGVPSGCTLASQLLGVDLTDCTDPQAECVGDCIVDAECATIVTLATDNPDPALSACIGACLPDCLGCVTSSCGGDLTDCNAEPVCQDFIMCAVACPEGDGACVNQCAVDNPSAETTAVLDCAATNCSSECLGGAGGAGGSGGGGN